MFELSVQSKCEWLVVSKDVKLSTFKEIPEMFDGEVHSQQF